MDTNEQVAAYRAWLAATPKVARVASGNVIRLALTPSALWDAIQEAFAANYTASVTNMTNAESLDGFLAWYNQVYLPSLG